VVQHDRKFFLPETGRVLRRSVRELPDFSAQNALVAFETISQYANNLFTKPWRKEYRTLKVDSLGFYVIQHQTNPQNHLFADIFGMLSARHSIPPP